MPESVGAAVLATFGVDFEKSREAIEYIFGHAADPPKGRISLTRSGKKAVELGVAEAARMKHRNIGSEHLLIGLVAEGEGIAAGVLKTHGCTLETVRRATTHEFIEWVHLQRGANAKESTASERESDRMQAAQAAIQLALGALSSAPTSRFERDLIDALLVPQLVQIMVALRRRPYSPSVQAVRLRTEETLRLLARSAEVFRSHGMPGVADALDSAWLAVRRVPFMT
ncbi:MAG TPA: Clp protease N-terminal domain-containing protein [Dehalococcoidia bacterium]|nr:Clp protease N-terminal domain-containing protein [Dehalococcoidia bacterium]